jgi:hypothetical protein
MTGDPVTGALSVGIPWAAAKLNTSRPVIDYLSRPQSELSRWAFGKALPFTGREVLRPVPGLLDLLEEEDAQSRKKGRKE